MAAELGISESFVTQLAATSSHRYKTYTISKRSGGVRVINHPSKELKALQRWLLKEILPKFPVHPAAMAYRPSKSIRHNAEAHAKFRFLLRLDLEDFFHSLTAVDISHHFSIHKAHLPPGWSDYDTSIFAALTTRYGRLTMGAVTSPAISNTLCHSLDINLSAVAASFGCTYTRYADDLYFSSSTPDVLKQVHQRAADTISNLAHPKGLKINNKKTVHTSTKRNRTVTGLVLTPTGKVSVGRSFKRKIRSMIFRSTSLTEAELRTLAGHLGYCKGVEPDFISRLIIKYGVSKIDALLKARPPENEIPVRLNTLPGRLTGLPTKS